MKRVVTAALALALAAGAAPELAQAQGGWHHGSGDGGGGHHNGGQQDQPQQQPTDHTQSDSSGDQGRRHDGGGRGSRGGDQSGSGQAQADQTPPAQPAAPTWHARVGNADSYGPGGDPRHSDRAGGDRDRGGDRNSGDNRGADRDRGGDRGGDRDRGGGRDGRWSGGQGNGQDNRWTGRGDDNNRGDRGDPRDRDDRSGGDRDGRGYGGPGWNGNPRWHGGPGVPGQHRMRDRDRGRAWFEQGRYRQEYRADRRFHVPYRFPRGFYERAWGYGEILPYGWYDQGYYLDWQDYDLPAPPIGCEWVQVGRDALLVDVWSGEVLSVYRNIFWW